MKSRIENIPNNKTLPKQYEHENEMFIMWLLFDHEPVRPDSAKIRNALEEKFGAVSAVSEGNEVTSFGIKKYISHMKEGDIPSQVIMGNIMPFDTSCISDEERLQIRDIENRDAFLKKCTHKILAADMMAALAPHDRAELLMDWLETAVELLPDCRGIYFPSSGKVIPSSFVKNKSAEGEDRFVFYTVNTRFFNVSGSSDMLADTRGMSAVGLTDIQCHFNGMSPENVINYLYNIAALTCQPGIKIKDGDTIDGLNGDEIDPDAMWACRYEDAMIPPMRPVIDICPGKYAAGQREK